MINEKRFSLNRIICPGIGLEDFFKLTADLGLNKVELRNDLPGKGIIDELTPERLRELADQYGIEIITINALQKFNLSSRRSRLMDELRQLLDIAATVRCQAVVLCPNNDESDSRNQEQIRRETVENLKSFTSLFENRGLTGLVEPLGFPESSLGSIITTMDIIRETGCSRYKVVHDTFHHHLGPDNLEVLRKDYDISYTGLVHVSGVEKELPKEQFRDENRILVGPKDRLKSREQVNLLLELGYSGDISFEPFSKEIQSLPVEELKEEIRASIDYLCC